MIVLLVLKRLLNVAENICLFSCCSCTRRLLASCPTFLSFFVGKFGLFRCYIWINVYSPNTGIAAGRRDVETRIKSIATCADLSRTSNRCDAWVSGGLPSGLILPSWLYSMIASLISRLLLQKEAKASPSLTWSCSGKPTIMTLVPSNQLNSTLFDENEHMNIITGHIGLEAAYICPTYK